MMGPITCIDRPVLRCLAVLAACVASLQVAVPASGDENAALDYYRAILLLGAVDPEVRDDLTRPVWEVVAKLDNDAGREGVNRLLIASRHAIRAALAGSRRQQADFGLDAETYAQSPFLPHCAPMGDLASLVALYGLQLQSEQRWEQAADAQLAVLRMGRHMANQSTLAEAVVGARMIESGFYGLSFWATQCPDPRVAAHALEEFEKLTQGMMNPESVMTSELELRMHRQAELLRQFPDGPWAEMLLDMLDVEPVDGDPTRMREAVVAAAAERGVPREVFRDRDALSGYVKQLQSLYAEYARAVIDCTNLASTREQIMRGGQIQNQFAPRFEKVGNPAEIDPGQLVAFLASHHAERTLTRTALAIATGRTADGFPQELTDVAGALGGSVPVSPYDGSPIVYTPTNDRRGYSLTIPDAKVGEITLPKIELQAAGDRVESR